MEFEESVRQWKELLARKERVEAESFYYENVFPEVLERFRSRGRHLKNYRYLISLLGFSPAPIILLIKTINPEKVLFITSEEAGHHLDLIQRETGLPLSRIDLHWVNSSESTEVYSAIKNFVVGKKEPQEVLVDITGGKKAMVGGAAMAGNVLGMDVCYVDYERYDPELRQPDPGTEYPNILKNPLQVLGDIDFQRAKEFFNEYHFARCIEVLNELDRRVEDLWGVRRLKALAEIYSQVDTFHFEGAASKLERVLEEKCGDNRFVSDDDLQRWRGVLEVLVKKDHPDHRLYSCLNYFYSGRRFAERKRFDIAVFLMYRTIEMILAGALKEAGIDPSNPVYPPELTVDLYNSKLKEVYEDAYFVKELPPKVGLMDCAIFLSMKNHPLVKDLNLKGLQGIVRIRNDSHFTHGSRPLGEEDYNKIRRQARKLLEQYLALSGRGRMDVFEGQFALPKIE